MVKDYGGIKFYPEEGAVKKEKEYQGIFQICFLLAIFYLVRKVVSIIIFSFSVPIFLIYLVYYFLPIFLAGYLYMYYKKQKLNSSFLGGVLFLIMLVVMLPFIGAVIEIISQKFFTNINLMLTSEYFSIIISFSDIFLFSAILIICGNYIKREIIFLLISIGNLD